MVFSGGFWSRVCGFLFLVVCRYLTWDLAKFPNPEAMQNKLAAKGRKVRRGRRGEKGKEGEEREKGKGGEGERYGRRKGGIDLGVRGKLSSVYV